MKETNLNLHKKEFIFHDTYFLILDGIYCETKSHFFELIKTTKLIPDYFSDNFDSFEEIINDLSWIEAEHKIIIINHSDVFLDDEKEDKEILYNILNQIENQFVSINFI